MPVVWVTVEDRLADVLDRLRRINGPQRSLPSRDPGRRIEQIAGNGI